ncbi:hypothetical protein QJS10_CPB17g02145 [Acorus calamus]|uniref:Uncharacterized protein n=1 Tax=Acorus calamus TaxID=4465 RepID=A0AAV9CRI0_ACOCL|nr:hypothetical protein QJS10_CPB17g02145 [Acorus calamus]
MDETELEGFGTAGVRDMPRGVQGGGGPGEPALRAPVPLEVHGPLARSQRALPLL